MIFFLPIKGSFFLLFFLLTTYISGQNNLNVLLDGDSTSYSGATYHMTAPSSGNFDVSFKVYNIDSLNSYLLYVTCIEISPLNGWTDGFCWGPSGDPVSGQCYNSSQVDSSYWVSPHSMLINPGEHGALKADFHPDLGSFGQSQYRYLFGVMQNGFINNLDSVDLIIDYFMDVPGGVGFSSSFVYPNPASDVINVSFEGVSNKRIEIYNVLGNKINRLNIESSKSIDVSAYKNGIYFIKISSPNQKTIINKVLIRH